jgi:four helix bundle protein
MSDVRSYRDLEVWQLAMEMVHLVYDLSVDFPPDERYGLTAQMRRAAVSVPSNIAEGHARRSLRAYLNHLGIALGSLGELDTELEIAARLRLCSGVKANALRDRISRTRQTVHGLRRSLELRLFASFGAVATILALATRAFT